MPRRARAGRLLPSAGMPSRESAPRGRSGRRCRLVAAARVGDVRRSVLMSASQEANALAGDRAAAAAAAGQGGARLDMPAGGGFGALRAISPRVRPQIRGAGAVSRVCEARKSPFSRLHTHQRRVATIRHALADSQTASRGGTMRGRGRERRQGGRKIRRDAKGLASSRWRWSSAAAARAGSGS